jgi:hypothetical protein
VHALNVAYIELFQKLNKQRMEFFCVPSLANVQIQDKYGQNTKETKWETIFDLKVRLKFFSIFLHSSLSSSYADACCNSCICFSDCMSCSTACILKQSLNRLRYAIKQEKLNFYFSEMASFPSIIRLYRMSILLFIPINRPTETINIISNAMVISTAVELST